MKIEIVGVPARAITDHPRRTISPCSAIVRLMGSSPVRSLMPDAVVARSPIANRAVLADGALNISAVRNGSAGTACWETVDNTKFICEALELRPILMSSIHMV